MTFVLEITGTDEDDGMTVFIETDGNGLHIDSDEAGEAWITYTDEVGTHRQSLQDFMEADGEILRVGLVGVTT